MKRKPYSSIQTLKNKDFLLIGDSLKSKPAIGVDIRNNFSVPARSKYAQFDGVHLTIEGQTVIVRALIDKLTNGK